MSPDFLAPLVAALRDLTSFLKDRKVSTTIIGGIAASLLGRPRVTRDIDALVQVDIGRLQELVNEAQRYGFSPRISGAVDFARANRVLLLRHVPSSIDIDIALAGLPFEEEAVKRATLFSIGQTSIPLPTPEDLIIMKAVAHRPHDMSDIEGIVAAHQEIDLQRVNYWLTQFADLLEQPEILSETERIIKSGRKA